MRCGALSGQSNNGGGCGTQCDHQTGKVLAYVLATLEDSALKQLQHLLAPFLIQLFYRDSWGAYLRLLDEQHLTVGKANTH